MNIIMENYDPNNRPGPGKTMRNVFGIFMVLIYVGMGILCFINFFGWDADWQWLRWVAGTLFVAYGVWRCYRQVKGMN
ncbi:MAG: hypothetical protein K2K59_00665 [Muribaculaceae bacterium]|nr:hypothetical protein [Muribaculaceae bacterium]